MEAARVLIIGGGIGGLTAAIALARHGFETEIVERDPKWSVYGVGIIQQSNVVRAMAQLGLLDDYLGSAFGFDHVAIHPPGGPVIRVPSPRLVPGRPANVGIGRPALHKLLGARALELGSRIRLGVTVTSLEDDGESVAVALTDGGFGRYDIVIGADGVYSTTRPFVLPEAPRPEFTGQGVWRYNFPRPDSIDCLHAYEGRIGIGLVPLSTTLMYLYVTTPEPENAHYPQDGLAAAMRAKLSDAPPEIAALAEQITDNAAVVYRPLECLLVEGPWHKGRVVLIGDAVHATTPHLGQGAGMAIEDSIVLAEEIARAPDPETAFQAYHARRFARCAYIVKASRAICDGQLGRGARIDQTKAVREMFEMTSQPI